nr:EbhA [uncultured Trichococcus sp.]
MKEKSKKNKFVLVGLIGLVIMVFAGGYWYTQFKVPHDKAVSKFNAAQQTVQLENQKLDDAVLSAQEILDSNETPYESSVFTELQTTISSAKESKRSVPTLPEKTVDIIEATDKLNEPLDYSETIAELEIKQLEAENSIQQYAQILNPTGDFVVLRLNDVPSIQEIQSVTEENDPNGQLNKQGGYTSAIFFSSVNVNQNDLIGNSVIEKGTIAGGSIEVYNTIEDAEARNNYLSAFDGGFLSAGSHNIVGTVVVRTSDELTATQQKDLESEIVNKLVELR